MKLTTSEAQSELQAEEKLRDEVYRENDTIVAELQRGSFRFPRLPSYQTLRVCVHVCVWIFFYISVSLCRVCRYCDVILVGVYMSVCVFVYIYICVLEVWEF